MKAVFVVLLMILLISGCESPTEVGPNYVKINPQFYAGQLKQTTYGGLAPFSISVKTAYLDNEIYEFWDFGDGTSDAFISGTIKHIYPHFGSYLLIVDVYKTDGTYIGRDTTPITLLKPEISIPDIKKMRGVEVILYLDSTYLSNLPDSMKFPIGADVNTHASITSVFTWTGNNFSAYDNTYNVNGSVYVKYSITGTLSEDYKLVKSATVSYKFLEENKIKTDYSFTVSNLNIFAITNMGEYVYKISADSLRDNISNLSYSGEKFRNPRNFFYFVNMSQNPVPAQAFLVFSKLNHY